MSLSAPGEIIAPGVVYIKQFSSGHISILKTLLGNYLYSAQFSAFLPSREPSLYENANRRLIDWFAIREVLKLANWDAQGVRDFSFQKNCVNILRILCVKWNTINSVRVDKIRYMYIQFKQKHVIDITIYIHKHTFHFSMFTAFSENYYFVGILL